MKTTSTASFIGSLILIIIIGFVLIQIGKSKDTGKAGLLEKINSSTLTQPAKPSVPSTTEGQKYISKTQVLTQQQQYSSSEQRGGGQVYKSRSAAAAGADVITRTYPDLQH